MKLPIGIDASGIQQQVAQAQGDMSTMKQNIAEIKELLKAILDELRKA